MRCYRKRSAAFFRQQHNSNGTLFGDVRYEEGYLGVSCFDAPHFAYTLLCMNHMICVENPHGHWDRYRLVW